LACDVPCARDVVGAALPAVHPFGGSRVGAQRGCAHRVFAALGDGGVVCGSAVEPRLSYGGDLFLPSFEDAGDDFLFFCQRDDDCVVTCGAAVFEFRFDAFGVLSRPLGGGFFACERFFAFGGSGFFAFGGEACVFGSLVFFAFGGPCVGLHQEVIRIHTVFAGATKLTMNLRFRFAVDERVTGEERVCV
jgi:hypothetical protein